jgi:hypothetical protein
MIRGGEVVTWPKVRFRLFSNCRRFITDWRLQLHMIENRFRLEKQVLLGRQAARRSLQSKTRTISPPPDSHQETREQSGSTFLSSAPPAPTGSDIPLSVDTDAETAFADGTHWFFRREQGTPPGTCGASTPREPGVNPQPLRLRTTLMRRKWAAFHGDDSSRSATPDLAMPSQSVVQQTSATGSKGFFVRLRSQSFPSFSSLARTNAINAEVAADEVWSSESSSEGDIGVDARRNVDDENDEPVD